jgi:hypothetical protein
MPTSPLDSIIARFDPIGLAEMDGVGLQARMDSKYMFAEARLGALLEALRPAYRLLEVDGVRGADYRSLYLDTPGYRHYLDHQNGRTFRSKVRYREYVGSGLCFLEVKRKTGRGGTDKVRRPVAGIPEAMSPMEQAFVAAASACAEPLSPVLWNRFSRLTLVHRTRPERLTIDRHLHFTDGAREVRLDGLCVAELKEGRTGHGSPFRTLMHTEGVHLSSMSKYCVGLVLLGRAPKHNAFKATLLRVERLRAAA